ncbi:hypothetical protein PMEGAPL103_10620 [Priestia megaterium]
MKISTGTEFYDNDETFLAYTKRRQQKENANDTIEKPAILQLLGDVTDANVLDLGCGNAGFGTELLEQGCFSYTGRRLDQYDKRGSATAFKLSKCKSAP